MGASNSFQSLSVRTQIVPISVICVACDSRFTAPLTSAGKRGKCPKCGEPIIVSDFEDELDLLEVPPTTEPQLELPPTEVKPRLSSREKWMVWGLMAFVGTLFSSAFVYTLVRNDERPQYQSDSERSKQRFGNIASAEAKKHVRKKLLSPASATFSDVTVKDTGKDIYGDHTCAVIGLVDSKNAFGVDSRKKFLCLLVDHGASRDVECLSVMFSNP